MTTRLRSPEPGSARQLAFEILLRVEREGAFASVLLEHAERRVADTRDAALLHEVVLGVLRQRAALDHVISRVASRPAEGIDLPVRTAIRTGAYACLFLDRVPSFAAVDTAVDLVKRSGPASAAGFVNAVLRRVAATGRDLLPSPPAEGDVPGLALTRSHPQWWVSRIVERLGWEEADRLLEANNRSASTVLRPNLRRTTPRDLSLRLLAEGVRTEPCALVPEALRVVSGIAQRTRTFREGYAWIQDEASQLVARLFGRVLRLRVLDLCAAPGGKSLQLAESLPVGGVLIAADRHARRLGRLVENLRRLEVRDVLPVVADMTSRAPLRAGFDHVLIDAPCSGTGTLRRHPEIRWRLLREDLPKLAALQGRLLETGASLTAAGGSLVYSTCSLEPEEGEEVVAKFLAQHTEFRVADPRPGLPEPARRLVGPEGALRTSPVDGLDGFYAIRLVR